MKHNSYLMLKVALLTTSVITSVLSISAQAELIEYKYNGIDLVYSTVSDVSWLKDADLFCTMTKRDGADTVVNKIINANGGKLQDGSQTVNLAKSDFGWTHATNNNTLEFLPSSDGCILPHWHGAMAFIKYLNTISYGGLNTWQLPTVNATENVGYTTYNAAAQNVIQGYNGPFNGAVSGNEFPELFYKELGAKPIYQTNGVSNNGGVGVQRSANALQIFNNLKWGYNLTGDAGSGFDGYARMALYWTQSSSQRSNAVSIYFNQFSGLEGYVQKRNSSSLSEMGMAWPITDQIKPEMTIVGAFYGKEGQPAWDVNGKRVVDTIRASQSSKTSLNVPANMNQYFGGDPLPNQPKIVAVQVQWGNRTFNLRQVEGKALKFPGVEGTDYYLYKQ